MVPIQCTPGIFARFIETISQDNVRAGYVNKLLNESYESTSETHLMAVADCLQAC